MNPPSSFEQTQDYGGQAKATVLSSSKEPALSMSKGYVHPFGI